MGGKIRDNRRRINVTVDEETYNQIKTMAEKNPDKNVSMNSIVRDFTMQGLNGTLTESNMEFILPIIRQTIKEVTDYQFERIAKMIAKTCIQAGASAYLSAEALNKFVSEDQQVEFTEAYIAARKKAVQYMKNRAVEE